ncbi:hypothetical protein ABZ901_17230, partial [Actinacidiphila alni]|uniref:hypothetical protein n=1 Tax=Actinacidiphila alni TaxID=380248 RepID=UPI0033FB9BC1
PAPASALRAGAPRRRAATGGRGADAVMNVGMGMGMGMGRDRGRRRYPARFLVHDRPHCGPRVMALGPDDDQSVTVGAV